MRTAQCVDIPNGLIRELIQWAEDELETSIHDTQYRQDLATFADRLSAAENEID